jgi:hypothetical protein
LTLSSCCDVLLESKYLAKESLELDAFNSLRIEREFNNTGLLSLSIIKDEFESLLPFESLSIDLYESFDMSLSFLRL